LDASEAKRLGGEGGSGNCQARNDGKRGLGDTCMTAFQTLVPPSPRLFKGSGTL
jgi:hypothetical protein